MRRAFTLIEMLTITAIILAVLGTLLPAISLAREQGRLAVCSANMRSLADGANAHQFQRDRYPVVAPLDPFALHGVLSGFVDWPEPSLVLRAAPWTCPSDRTMPGFARPLYEHVGTSFYYHFGTIEQQHGGAETIYRLHPYLPLFAEGRLYHGRGSAYNASFPDGHVSFLKHQLTIWPP